MRRRRSRWGATVRAIGGAIALCGLGCASTCSSGGDTAGVIGELGNGDFRFVCLDDADAACSPALDGSATPEFPGCVALGSRFGLTYSLIDDSAISTDAIPAELVVTAGNEDFLGRGENLHARRAGRAVVVVRHEDHVIDLLHLDVVAPTEMRLLRRDGSTVGDRIALAVGESLTVFAHPGTTGCFDVGGSLPLRVRQDGELLRSVARISDGDTLRIEGVAHGVMTVQVELGDLLRELTIEVADTASDPTGSGTGTGPGTSSGTSTGTVSDTDTDVTTNTDTDLATDTGSGTGTGGGG